MGSSSSCLSSVTPLNVSGADDEPDPALLEKLAGQPALLSKPVPGLSLLLGGTGQTWFHIACERKQLQIVQRMCEFLAGSSPATVREALGPYCRRVGLPLPGSAAEGLRIAVGMCNGKGQTPLMHACYAGCPQLVKYLLEQGANPWASDRCGCRTALHYAAISGCVGSVAALMRSTAVVQPMRGGTRYVDARSLSGMTALHYAVLYERHGVLVELLRHGPDINATTGGCGADAAWLDCDTAATPLHFAAARGNAVCALELLRNYASRHHAGSTADPRLARNAGGQQPWQLAVSQHPAQRYLALVLQPGHPLPRMGAGGEEGVRVVALGPPSLASIAASALRQKLLAAVEAAEAPEVAEAQTVEALEVAAAPEVTTKVAMARKGNQEDAGDASPAGPSARTFRHMVIWTGNDTSGCDGGGGSSSHKLPVAGGGGSAATTAVKGPRGGAACNRLQSELACATRSLSASVVSVRHRYGGGDVVATATGGGGGGGRGGGSGNDTEPTPAAFLPPLANSFTGGGGSLQNHYHPHRLHHLLHHHHHHFHNPHQHHHNHYYNHHNHRNHHNHHHSNFHSIVSSRLVVRAGSGSRSPPEGCASSCCRLPLLDCRHPFGIPEQRTDSQLSTANSERLRSGRDGAYGGSSGGCCLGSSRLQRRDTEGEWSPMSGCFRPGAAARSSRFRRRAFSAAATVRAGGGVIAGSCGCSSHHRCDGAGFGAGGAHFAPLLDPKAATAARVRDAAVSRPSDAPPPAVDDNADDDDIEDQDARVYGSSDVENDSSDGEEGGGGGGSSRVCSVCYTRPEAMAPAGCGHGLCGVCARELCHGLKSRPLPCPFCRRPVANFVPLAAAVAAAAAAASSPRLL